MRAVLLPRLLLPLIVGLDRGAAAPEEPSNRPKRSLIRPSPDGQRFIDTTSNRPFVAWGFNYDHDAPGRLLEDYWIEEWATVTGDFAEMKGLGANVVRIHLQTGRFMKSADQPDPTALAQLDRLVTLAEETGLYLDVTGLGCYHKPDVPAWYDALDESGRWEVQARFWEAVAKTCARRDAIFCYDLMNEPILPGDKQETDWLAGAFGDMYFVQRISLNLAGRSRTQVAKAWVDKLTGAIHRHDNRHMITVGVIPWALSFPNAKPLFYDKEVCANLDFASVHFYPETGRIEEALKALAVYDVGKPLVVEEMFPLKCDATDLERFIDQSRSRADGYLSFYWGKPIEHYTAEDGIAGAMMKGWLEQFRIMTPRMTR